MTYENADRYLLLKQLLVTFTIVRKGAAVTIGGITYNEPMVVSRILHILNEIEENYTIPYALLRNPAIHLNLEGVSLYIGDLSTDEMVDGLALTAVRGLEDKEALEKSIYEYPIKNVFVKERALNIENNQMYHTSRNWAGEMVQASVKAVECIRAWVTFQNKMCLEQCIVLANCVELTEWLFSYTNDLYGAEDEPVGE